jgi:hypothetical protein
MYFVPRTMELGIMPPLPCYAVSYLMICAPEGGGMTKDVSSEIGHTFPIECFMHGTELKVDCHSRIFHLLAVLLLLS